MKQTTERILILCAALLFFGADLATASVTERERSRGKDARSASDAPDRKARRAKGDGPPTIWDDPEFQKQFLGSYGVNAEVEPRITQIEREALEAVLPLMSTDSEAALAQLRTLTTPESSALFDFTIAQIHFQAERFDEAAASYRQALHKFPSFRRAHKMLGLIHVRQGRFTEAIPHLSRVIETGGGDGLTYGLLGWSYGSADQHIAAESAYREAMLLQPDTRDWKLGLVQSLLEQHKYPEASRLLEELIRTTPEDVSLWLLQANAYIGLERPLDAARNFELVRRMGGATRASLYTLGDIYVNESMWTLAADAYRAALEADPEQDVARPLRSVEVLAQRGALEQARELLSAIRSTHVDAGRIDEEERKKVLKLEARLAVAQGQGGDAVGVLEQIVSLDPLDGEALMLLGEHYTSAGDAERAIFYYERAASLEGHEADAKVRIAQLLVGQSRYSEAVPLLERAQELEPRDEVARYLEQVERVARSRR